MLKRIQDIKSVGCFVNDHPASIQFETLTFIFGENCYGKSTLCDILRSLTDNRPDYITDRISIPNPDSQNQIVQLSFSTPKNGGESTAIFNQERWDPALSGDLRIYVFDTDFIHRNVFTGLTIERKNQENITQFVLGEANVRTAQRIADLNSKLRSINKDIRQLVSNTFKGIRDIPAFLAIEVSENPDELEKKIATQASELNAKSELSEDLENAKNRQEPQPLEVSDNIEAFVEQVNACLSHTYQRAHQAASEAVEKHIHQKTQKRTTTKNWLRDGIEQIAGDHCPFCGQVLEEAALKLLDVYRSFFDEAFNRLVTFKSVRMMAD